MKRKVFFTENKKPIVASGIIIKYENKFIMQYEYKTKAKSKYLADFGGKLESTDVNPYYGAIRELVEETNGYLYNCKHNVIDDIKKYIEYYDLLLELNESKYLANGKYMLYIVTAKKETYEKMLNLQEKFDEILTEGLSHQIVIKDKLKDNKVKIHPRIKNIII
jgi:hypothetical protein